MTEKNSSPFNVKLKIQINNLLTIYEQKAECGIFFKLSQDRSPLEIIGVLDFLKDRIKKWGNTNLFSYQGSLFRKGPTLVVGARDLEEALSITIYMYLSSIADSEYKMDYFLEKLDSTSDLERFLRNEISENLENGFPDNPDLDIELKKHLNNIIKDQNNNSSMSKKET